jgi:uncharacterized protein YukE
MDNTRADGMSGKQIYDLMTSGPGTASLDNGSRVASGLTEDYLTIEGRLRSVSASLGEGWTGSSAAAAEQAVSPINKGLIEMQTALKQTDRTIDNQSFQFNHNKAQLKPLPNEKPESGFWNDVAPWETDTDRAIDSYNSGENENRRVYTEYQSASGTNRSELPSNINGVVVDTFDVQVKDTSGESNSNLTTNSNGKYTSSSSSSGWNGSTQQSSVPPPSSYTQPPSVGNGDGTTTTSGNTGGTTLPSNTFPGVPGQGGQGGGLNNGGNTGFPGGFGVPGGPAGGGGAGRTGGAGRGAGGVGGMGGGRPGGGVGAGAFGAGRGAGEGFGPGGKSGVLGGMGAAEGAGRGAGGFGPGGGAAAGGRGAAGAAGMGGMGGGAKGQGDEDGEHRSAAYLVNEDNGNEIVGDMPLTAPPVLGG